MGTHIRGMRACKQQLSHIAKIAGVSSSARHDDGGVADPASAGVTVSSI